MSFPRKSVLLVQLPIPPVGPQPIRSNVPLAAAYLQMYAEQQGLGDAFQFDIFPPALANTLGDLALVEEMVTREPWLLGFTCYLWNIDRTLWIAAEVKKRWPQVKIILGGPEITFDNAWVLNHPAIDYAAIGEGEQTFAELLAALRENGEVSRPIAGLRVNARPEPEFQQPFPRKPLPNLNCISSPYLTGILDAADERMLLLETIRGCIFKCKFCYYPKSYDDLYFVSQEKIIANLQHAREHGAEEVVLLDPTLNQRRDFPAFLRLLSECNPDHQFTYFGELRAEGINDEVARLLKAANFHEVEIGLQSIDPLAMQLMDRNNNLKAFERGARAMLDHGLRVKVDLIIGLPGDTMESVRRGMRYLRDSGLYTDVQVFNLAILPGTAFRQEAETLGLSYQERTPYYVLNTPTLRIEDMYQLLAEAEDLFEREFDPLPPVELPSIGSLSQNSSSKVRIVDLSEHHANENTAEDKSRRSNLAFTLWFRGEHWTKNIARIRQEISTLLNDNPHTTLQVVLEPLADLQEVTTNLLEEIAAACFRQTSYLDRFYSVLPGRPKGAKRLVILLSETTRETLDPAWLESMEELADVVWEEQSHRICEVRQA